MIWQIVAWFGSVIRRFFGGLAGTKVAKYLAIKAILSGLVGWLMFVGGGLVMVTLSANVIRVLVDMTMVVLSGQNGVPNLGETGIVIQVTRTALWLIEHTRVSEIFLLYISGLAISIMISFYYRYISRGR